MRAHIHDINNIDDQTFFIGRVFGKMERETVIL